MSVHSVVFGVISPEEMRSYCVVEITNVETRLEKDSVQGASISYDGTVYDERMGTLDKKRLCRTCGLGTVQCPGHFGFISLKKAVVHPKHPKTLLAILKCVCIACRKLLITQQAAETMGILEHKAAARLKFLSKYCDGVENCPNCGEQLPLLAFKENSFEICYPAEGTKRSKSDKTKSTKVPPESIISVLKELTDGDCLLLGLNNYLTKGSAYSNPELYPTELSHRHQIRPEWFILTILPVLPPCARPPVYTEGKQREDDLTDGYVNIVKANIALTKHLNGTTRKKVKQESVWSQKNKKEPYDELCEKVRILIDNKEGKKTVNGQVPQGIEQLVKSKDGHIRNGVLGKRCNFTARTVITPDPGLRIGELGVPRRIANILTAKQIVCRSTWNEAKEMVDSGMCQAFVRKGRLYDVAVCKEKNFGKCELQPGDILISPLKNGFPLIFNRQPSLRVESMLGLKLVLHDDLTFKFNPSICTPMGAD